MCMCLIWARAAWEQRIKDARLNYREIDQAQRERSSKKHKMPHLSILSADEQLSGTVIHFLEGEPDDSGEITLEVGMLRVAEDEGEQQPDVRSPQPCICITLNRPFRKLELAGHFISISLNRRLS